MSGGGGSTSTTTQKADPWIGVQPALTSLYSNALTNYNSGGPQYFPDSTVAPGNSAIDTALQFGLQRAVQGSPQRNAAGAYLLNRTNRGINTPLFDTPSYSDSNPQFGGANFGAGSPNINANDQNATNAFNQFANGNLVGQNTANPYLNQGASGYYLDNQNPYLSGLYKSATDPLVEQFKNATAPGLASQFSLAGRLGSNSAQAASTAAEDSLARGLGAASSNIYGNAYENERNRQQQAIQTLSGNYNTEQGNRLQGANSLAQQAASQRANALATAQLESANNNYKLGLKQSATQFDRSQAQQYSQFQQQQQFNAAQASQGFAAGDYSDLDKLLQIGQYQQGTQQDLINAAKARYDFGQNRPTLNLQTLNQLLQGGAAYSGQTNTGATQTPRNPFAGAASGAATGAAIGSVVPVIGTGIGAVVGGLGGALFG